MSATRLPSIRPLTRRERVARDREFKKEEKIWEVYILETQSGKLYTGISTDVERRFSEHSEGVRGAKFFSFSPAKKIVFREKHSDQSSASRRESEIKKLSRHQKLGLIRSGNPSTNY